MSVSPASSRPRNVVPALAFRSCPDHMEQPSWDPDSAAAGPPFHPWWVMPLFSSRAMLFVLGASVDAGQLTVASVA